MKSKWTFFVAWRFITGRRGGRGRFIFLIGVLLICIGVATLNTILAVMNGLQQGFITSILEIGSYHIHWMPDGDDVDIDSAISTIGEDPDVVFVTPFREGITMLSGKRSELSGALIRGIPPDTYTRDKNLAHYLEIVQGEFNVENEGIVPGRILAYNLGVSPGDRVSVLTLSSNGVSTEEVQLEVTGIFQCGYQNYESSMAFVSLDTMDVLIDDSRVELGVKLIRPERVTEAMSRLGRNDMLLSGELSSWREKNSSFFGALRNEKIMMILLVTLIFVVVAVNIDHSLRRMATERIEDLSILKATGASPWNIRILFLQHGLVTGTLGGVSGSILGVLIGENINTIIQFFRSIQNRIVYTSWNITQHQTVDALFQNSQVMVIDVVYILSTAVILTFLAAVRASSMAARSKPAEVLRSE